MFESRREEPEAGNEESLVDLPPFTFWETRAGSGTPVVLVHGLSGSRHWWTHNFEALAAEHLVSAVDLVGFGRNRRFRPGTRLPLDFDDAASLLARWIAESFDEPVHLVGHSMGGHLCIYLAATHPELIRSLVLVNSTGLPFAIDPRAHLQSVYPVPPGVFSFSRVLARDLFRAGPSSVGIAAARLLFDDARAAMRSVRCPTLIVWGDRDPLVPMRYAEQLREEIAHAEFVVLPNAGHVSMWDNPVAFNQHVLDFFRWSEAQERREESASRASFGWGIAGAMNGMAWRSSGPSPDVVLVHGLGVSSTYFRPLAHALWQRGRTAVAPDLPGFGFSDALAVNAARDPEATSEWARAMKLGPCLWIGQSTGCQVVERVVKLAPDLVQRAVYISPIWTQRRHAAIALASKLAADGVLESPRLVATAFASYWRAGFVRFFRAWRFYLHDAQRERAIERESDVIIGTYDPLIDRDRIRALQPRRIIELSGAHAVHWTSAQDVAEVVDQRP